MNLLFCGGKNTGLIMEKLEARMNAMGVNVIRADYIPQIQDIYTRGDYFDRVVILEHAWKYDGQLTDINQMKQEIGNFIRDCERRHQTGKTYVYVTSDAEIADYIYNESYNLRDSTACLLHDANDKYTIKFFKSVSLTNISDMNPNELYTPSSIAGTAGISGEVGEDYYGGQQGYYDNQQGYYDNPQGYYDEPQKEVADWAQEGWQDQPESMGSYEEYGDYNGYNDFDPNQGDMYNQQPMPQDLPNGQSPSNPPSDMTGWASNPMPDTSLNWQDSSNNNPEMDDMYGAPQEQVPSPMQDQGSLGAGMMAGAGMAGAGMAGAGMMNPANPMMNPVTPPSPQVNSPSQPNMDMYNDPYADPNAAFVGGNSYSDPYSDPYGDMYGQPSNPSQPMNPQAQQSQQMYPQSDMYGDNSSMYGDNSSMYGDINPPSMVNTYDDMYSTNDDSEAQEQIQQIANLDTKKLKQAFDPFATRTESIVITGVDGAGTSTVAFQLANMLCNMKYNVILVDMDTMNRSQVAMSEAAYESMEPDGCNLQSAVNTTSSINPNIAVIRPGFRLLSMGLAGDLNPPDKLLKKDRLIRFANTVKHDHNFIIYDIPFDYATSHFAELVSMVDNIVEVVDESNWGVTKTMLRMCNIVEEDMQDIMFSKTQLLFNRVTGKNKILGRKVKNLRAITKAMDFKIKDLLGDSPPFLFQNLKICGSIPVIPDLDSSWYDNKQLTNTQQGIELFGNILYNILNSRSIQ